MCCWRSRRIPAAIVGSLSVAALIVGCVMIYFSVKFNSDEFIPAFKDIDEIKRVVDLGQIKTLVFLGLLIFSIIVLVIAIMGILMFKIKNRCYAICFGIILLPIWIVIFAVASAAMFANNMTADVLDSVCAEVIREVRSADKNVGLCGAYSSKLNLNFEVYEAILINNEMCSANCPCAPDAA